MQLKIDFGAQDECLGTHLQVFEFGGALNLKNVNFGRDKNEILYPS